MVKPTTRIEQSSLAPVTANSIGPEVSGRWIAPARDQIVVRNGQVICTATTQPQQVVSPKAGLLHRFVNLPVESERTIERFLRHWGPLGAWNLRRDGSDEFTRPLADVLVCAGAARAVLAAVLASSGEDSLGFSVRQAVDELTGWLAVQDASERRGLDGGPLPSGWTLRGYIDGFIGQRDPDEVSFSFPGAFTTADAVTSAKDLGISFEGFTGEEDPEAAAWRALATFGLEAWMLNVGVP